MTSVPATSVPSGKRDKCACIWQALLSHLIQAQLSHVSVCTVRQECLPNTGTLISVQCTSEFRDKRACNRKVLIKLRYNNTVQYVLVSSKLMYALININKHNIELER